MLRVTAIQRGEAIFHFEALFWIAEEGPSHQLLVRRACRVSRKSPLYEDEIRAELARHAPVIERDDRRFDLPIEPRTIGGLHLSDRMVRRAEDAHRRRAKGAPPDDLGLHQAALAGRIGPHAPVSAVLPYPVRTQPPGASLGEPC